MTFEIFGYGLLAVSVSTTLAVQAIKLILKEVGKNVPKNILASIVSVVLSIALSVGYGIVSGIQFSASYVVWTILLMFLGWLCACLSYDKVKQAFEQAFGGKKK